MAEDTGAPIGGIGDGTMVYGLALDTSQFLQALQNIIASLSGFQDALARLYVPLDSAQFQQIAGAMSAAGKSAAATAQQSASAVVSSKTKETAAIKQNTQAVRENQAAQKQSVAASATTAAAATSAPNVAASIQADKDRMRSADIAANAIIEDSDREEAEIRRNEEEKRRQYRLTEQARIAAIRTGMPTSIPAGAEGELSREAFARLRSQLTPILGGSIDIDEGRFIGKQGEVLKKELRERLSQTVSSGDLIGIERWLEERAYAAAQNQIRFAGSGGDFSREEGELAKSATGAREDLRKTLSARTEETLRALKTVNEWLETESYGAAMNQIQAAGSPGDFSRREGVRARSAQQAKAFLEENIRTLQAHGVSADYFYRHMLDLRDAVNAPEQLLSAQQQPQPAVAPAKPALPSIPVEAPPAVVEAVARRDEEQLRSEERLQKQREESARSAEEASERIVSSVGKETGALAERARRADEEATKAESNAERLASLSDEARGLAEKKRQDAEAASKAVVDAEKKAQEAIEASVKRQQELDDSKDASINEQKALKEAEKKAKQLEADRDAAVKDLNAKKKAATEAEDAAKKAEIATESTQTTKELAALQQKKKDADLEVRRAKRDLDVSKEAARKAAESRGKTDMYSVNLAKRPQSEFDNLVKEREEQLKRAQENAKQAAADLRAGQKITTITPQEAAARAADAKRKREAADAANESVRLATVTAERAAAAYDNAMKDVANKKKARDAKSTRESEEAVRKAEVAAKAALRDLRAHQDTAKSAAAAARDAEASAERAKKAADAAKTQAERRRTISDNVSARASAEASRASERDAARQERSVRREASFAPQMSSMPYTRWNDILKTFPGMDPSKVSDLLAASDEWERIAKAGQGPKPTLPTPLTRQMLSANVALGDAKATVYNDAAQAQLIATFNSLLSRFQGLRNRELAEKLIGDRMLDEQGTPNLGLIISRRKKSVVEDDKDIGKKKDDGDDGTEPFLDPVKRQALERILRYVEKLENNYARQVAATNETTKAEQKRADTTEKAARTAEALFRQQKLYELKRAEKQNKLEPQTLTRAFDEQFGAVDMLRQSDTGAFSVDPNKKEEMNQWVQRSIDQRREEYKARQAANTQRLSQDEAEKKARRIQIEAIDKINKANQRFGRTIDAETQVKQMLGGKELIKKDDKGLYGIDAEVQKQLERSTRKLVESMDRRARAEERQADFWNKNEAKYNRLIREQASLRQPLMTRDEFMRRMVRPSAITGGRGDASYDWDRATGRPKFNQAEYEAELAKLRAIREEHRKGNALVEEKYRYLDREGNMLDTILRKLERMNALRKKLGMDPLSLEAFGERFTKEQQNLKNRYDPRRDDPEAANWGNVKFRGGIYQTEMDALNDKQKKANKILSDQNKLHKQNADAMMRQSMYSNDMLSNLARGVLRLAEWVVLYRVLHEVIINVQRVLSAIVQSGIEYATIQEQQLIGLKGILAENYKWRDELGRNVDKVAAISLLTDQARQQWVKLQRASLTVVGTTADLMQLYEGILPYAAKLGRSLDEIQEMTQGAAIAAGSLGISFQDARSAMISLLQGRTLTRNKLVGALGFTKQEISELKGTPMLFDAIMQKLRVFSATANESQKSVAALKESLKDYMGMVGAGMFAPAINEFKTFMAFLTKALFDVDALVIKPKETLLGFIEFAKTQLRAIIEPIKQSIGAWAEGNSNQFRMLGLTVTNVVKSFALVLVWVFKAISAAALFIQRYRDIAKTLLAVAVALSVWSKFRNLTVAVEAASQAGTVFGSVMRGLAKIYDLVAGALSGVTTKTRTATTATRELGVASTGTAEAVNRVGFSFKALVAGSIIGAFITAASMVIQKMISMQRAAEGIRRAYDGLKVNDFDTAQIEIAKNMAGGLKDQENAARLAMAEAESIAEYTREKFPNELNREERLKYQTDVLRLRAKIDEIEKDQAAINAQNAKEYAEWEKKSDNNKNLPKPVPKQLPDARKAELDAAIQELAKVEEEKASRDAYLVTQINKMADMIVPVRTYMQNAQRKIDENNAKIASMTKWSAENARRPASMQAPAQEAQNKANIKILEAENKQLQEQLAFWVGKVEKIEKSLLPEGRARILQREVQMTPKADATGLTGEENDNRPNLPEYNDWIMEQIRAEKRMADQMAAHWQQVIERNPELAEEGYNAIDEIHRQFAERELSLLAKENIEFERWINHRIGLLEQYRATLDDVGKQRTITQEISDENVRLLKHRDENAVRSVDVRMDTERRNDQTTTRRVLGDRRLDVLKRDTEVKIDEYVAQLFGDSEEKVEAHIANMIEQIKQAFEKEGASEEAKKYIERLMLILPAAKDIEQANSRIKRLLSMIEKLRKAGDQLKDDVESGHISPSQYGVERQRLREREMAESFELQLQYARKMRALESVGKTDTEEYRAAQEGLNLITRELERLIAGIDRAKVFFDAFMQSLTSMQEVASIFSTSAGSIIGSVVNIISSASKLGELRKSINWLKSAFKDLGKGASGIKSFFSSIAGGGKGGAATTGAAVAGGIMVGAAAAMAIGTMLYQKAVAKAKKGMQESIDSVTKALKNGTIEIGKGLVQLEKARADAVKRYSSSKSGRAALREMLPEFDSQIEQMREQIKSIRKSFEDNLKSLSAGTGPYGDMARRLFELEKQTREYLDTFSRDIDDPEYIRALENVNELWQITLDNMKREMTQSMQGFEGEAIGTMENLFGLIEEGASLQEQMVALGKKRNELLEREQDLRDEIRRLMEETAESESEILRRGVLEAQLSVAEQKANEIANLRFDAMQKLNDLQKEQAGLADDWGDLDKEGKRLDKQITLNALRVETARQIAGIESTVFNIAKNEYALAQQRSELEIETAKLRVEKWYETKQILDNIKEDAEGMFSFDPANIEGFPQIRVQIGNITIDNRLSQSTTVTPPGGGPPRRDDREPREDAPTKGGGGRSEFDEDRRRGLR